MWILSYRTQRRPDPRSAWRFLKLGAVAAALLFVATAGCGPAETPDSPAAPPDTAAAPPTADAPGTDTLGAWRATNLDVERAAAGVVVLRAVRTAAHDGYDRIVFEFDGQELPGYHLEYIDRPVRACGSGQVVPLTGDGTLQVRMSPAQAHTEAGEPTVAERERSPGLPVVEMLKLTCDFEADVTWVAGVSAPNPYRVTELSDPVRLVVDVRH